MISVEFILYVEDQNKSKQFYEALWQSKPILDVPGMTEFQLTPSVKLGLMPAAGIANILGNKMPHPSTGNGIPRCELYLKVKHPERYMALAIQLGAIEISPLQTRNWGEKVGYISDLDGHIIAFAEHD